MAGEARSTIWRWWVPEDFVDGLRGPLYHLAMVGNAEV